jgi:hypothetical protein
MGDVIPFRPRRARLPAGPARLTAREQALLDAVEAGGDRAAVLRAAGPLLQWMGHEHGCIVMRRGMPEEPRAIAAAILALSRALAAARREAGRSDRPLDTFGAYLGQDRLAWFEDGYGGATGLAVPVGVDAEALAAFIASRFRGQARGRPG